MVYITIGLVLVAGWSATVLYLAMTGDIQGIDSVSRTQAKEENE